MGHRFVDDDDGGFVGAIGGGEIAAAQQTQAERGEIIWRDRGNGGETDAGVTLVEGVVLLEKPHVGSEVPKAACSTPGSVASFSVNRS